MNSLLVFAISLMSAFAVCAQDTQSGRSAGREYLQEQIRQQQIEYQKRPSKQFRAQTSNAKAVEDYLSQCVTKIQSVGNLNYPSDAKGRLYGSVLVSFDVFPSGQISNIRVEQSSGQFILDNSTQRAVELASPCEPFPQKVKDHADRITVTRTFSYIKNTVTDELLERHEP